MTKIRLCMCTSPRLKIIYPRPHSPTTAGEDKVRAEVPDHEAKTESSNDVPTQSTREAQRLQPVQSDQPQSISSVGERRRSGRPRKEVRQEFPCSGCDRVFYARRLLLEHEGIHEDPPPFLCEECPKGYPTERLLIRHEKTHFRRQPFRCPHCPKKFPLAIQAYVHEKKIHLETKVKSRRCKKTDSKNVRKHRRSKSKL